MKRFNKILIANRGEIAVRILRTCRDMGIATVAVFSDADRDANFVIEADEAIHIGPAPSAESYLRIDRIIRAAKRSRADAIHPGYGFLAENAAFAQACADAEITFIGPSPAAIALLGSKKASKDLVQRAGVPVLPGYDESKPDEIVYPILLKASAGGGGKGMQIVRNAADLGEALESTRRVALSAFGDDTLLLEHYVESPRHIEIQILGDRQGNLVHLFERECSIQRRHQKIIEESPAPGLDPELRDKIASAALSVGKAAGYLNAGTVEFIVSQSGAFYFLEVNTRLQVEHPVTECVTGLDLVREQIRIAQGEPLGYEQADLQQHGAAIECRLYAEDCANDFMPCSGRLLDWHVPALPGLRVDTGVRAGSEISIHYDPMIAKIVSYAPSRDEAILKMRRALAGLSAAGVTTNRVFLDRVLAHDAFLDASIDTAFLSRHADELLAPTANHELLPAALMAATFATSEALKRCRSLLPAMTPGFRNSRWREERTTYRYGKELLSVGYRFERDGSMRMRTPVPGIALEATLESDAQMVRVVAQSSSESEIVLDLDGYRRRFRVTRSDDRILVLVDGSEFDFREQARFPAHDAVQIKGGCIAPMPGTVVKVSVKNGDAVKSGDTLLILEAMKMEHRIKADRDGRVDGLSVSVGDQVEDAQLLAVVADTGSDGSPSKDAAR